MDGVEYTSPVRPNSGIHRILQANDSGHHMFISHLDRTPVAAKRRLFFLYGVTYSLFAAFILWRFFNGSTRYLPMLIPGLEWAGLMDRPGRKPSSSLLWTMINIGIDSFVATSLLPAVRSFITEQVWLRVKYGFRPVEVVFRTPTNWESGNLNKLAHEARENQLFSSIHEAANSKWVHSRPGDSTWTSIWRIECGPTGAVYDALASGNADFSLEDWQLTVWQKKSDGSWFGWELWKINKATEDKLKVVYKMKERLEEMGKADVYDRFIQIFGKTPELASLERDQEIQQVFESAGLDFVQLFNDAWTAAYIPVPEDSSHVLRDNL